MKYLTNIDLTQNELQNVVIQNLATAPSSPKKGQIYYNSSENVLYQYNGTEWLEVGTDTNTTYDLSVGSASSNIVPITLVGSDGSTDKVNIKGSGGATITSSPSASGVGTITISTVDNNTTYTFKGASGGSDDTYIITITPSSGDTQTITIPKATTSMAGLIDEAPSDSKQYARKNGAWAEVVGNVSSVNGKTGAVKLTYEDVGADQLGAASAVQNSIQNGSVVAGKASADENGNNIVDTYYPKSNPSGYTSNTGTITKVQANGADVSSSGTANIPAATTSAYGVTKLLDAVNNTSTSLALTANQGKILQDQINSLKNIGKFISIWNATTGLPTSEPASSPYEYHTGDYYRVSNVTDTPTDNLIPNGSSYTTGVASTTHFVPTTEEPTLQVGDVYYFDGTNWILEASGGHGLVQDVQVNSTSIVSGGIANIDLNDFGITASATELNYTKNVTSNIQTQLNSKGTYSKPSDGIPKSDLSSAVQTAIDNANLATKKYTTTNPALTSSGGACTWDISSSTHNLGTGDLIVQIYEVSTGSMIIADITVASDNDVSITFTSSSSILAGIYKVVIIG